MIAHSLKTTVLNLGSTIVGNNAATFSLVLDIAQPVPHPAQGIDGRNDVGMGAVSPLIDKGISLFT